jgi:nucleotide-binding universal stress UspA family protein
MKLQDIMVIVDDPAGCQKAVDLATNIALTHDAHLTAFCPLETMIAGGPQAVVGTYPELFMIHSAAPDALERAAAAAALLEQKFRNNIQQSGVNGTWETCRGLTSPETVQRARATDLGVLAQPDPASFGALRSRLVLEDLLMSAGRPLLVVPYAGKFTSLGRNVLIGWDGSREATRALHDALLLLEPGARVTLLTVERAHTGETQIDQPLGQHLEHHGMIVTPARTVRNGTISDSDAILNYAADAGTDLLVIGGYGHSRVREVMLGGVTRDLLDHTTVPVLISR